MWICQYVFINHITVKCDWTRINSLNCVMLKKRSVLKVKYVIFTAAALRTRAPVNGHVIHPMKLCI